MGKPHNVKIKPGTPLPWKYQAEGRVQFGILGSARLPVPHSTSANNQADAAYIAHAANMYGPLVEALRTLDPNHPVLKQAGEA